MKFTSDDLNLMSWGDLRTTTKWPLHNNCFVLFLRHLFSINQTAVKLVQSKKNYVNNSCFTAYFMTFGETFRA